jgi:halimadienyl-diphosphate synthase
MTHPFEELLLDIQKHPNAMSGSVYDMAWLAWLIPEAHDRLCGTQHPDGSWGADLEYYHDRVICTLAAINALAATSTNHHEIHQIERGIKYLERATRFLPLDPTETVGFELLAPSLVKIGKGLGLRLGRVAKLLEPYEAICRQKLSLIPPAMLYGKKSTVPHSLEFVGFDSLDRTAVAAVRFANGSIHNSPAATAFCEVAGASSTAGRDYLTSTMAYYAGGAPNLAPFEWYEINWALMHLALVEDLNQFGELVRPLLEKIRAGWGPEGIGLGEEFPVDLDNTAAAYTLLSKAGIAVDHAVFKAFEEADHFHCFRFERNISLDVHTRLVMALRQAPDFPGRDDMLLKAINILSRYTLSGLVTDKWHASPYYSTAHAVIALCGLADSMIEGQIYWLQDSQQKNGSWTYYPNFKPAAMEESAYALLALLVVQKQKGSVSPDVIKRGMDYLTKYYQDHQALPALWVDKGLYHPMHITRAIFLAVFALYDQLYQT